MLFGDKKFKRSIDFMSVNSNKRYGLLEKSCSDYYSFLNVETFLYFCALTLSPLTEFRTLLGLRM